MKLLFIGFGFVGQSLARILHTRAGYLHGRYGLTPQIVGVVTRSHGILYDPAGLDIPALLAGLADYPASARQTGEVLDFIRDCDADVLVEVSHTDLKTAQPALDYCRAALDSGKHVVMANKGPVALAYAELAELARSAGRHLRYEATVMAGTPALSTGLEALAGCEIKAALGILNGSTNYILSQMESGLDYAAAFQQARDLGYLEADPSADIDGWDAAGKAVILANALFGGGVTLDSMQVEGISGVTAAAVAEAQAAGEIWKLIAQVTPTGGSVAPRRLPRTHPLAGVGGATNAVTLTTDLLGDVTVIGPGAGGDQTAAGLLADLLAIHRGLNP